VREAGADIRTVSTLMGHVRESTTMLYQHATDDWTQQHVLKLRRQTPEPRSRA
jgi:site-specific recombinase XerD